MVVSKESKPAAEDYIEEMKRAVSARFPEAEFTVHRVKRNEYRIQVTADFDNIFDVLDLTADRTTDILVERNIYIGVTPLQRSREAE
jgi:hypothetical protein